MKNTKFNWQCIHCDKRNITIVEFQFDVPKQYTAQWMCSRCGNETKVIFTFGINLPTPNI